MSISLFHSTRRKCIWRLATSGGSERPCWKGGGWHSSKIMADNGPFSISCRSNSSSWRSHFSPWGPISEVIVEPQNETLIRSVLFIFSIESSHHDITSEAKSLMLTGFSKVHQSANSTIHWFASASKTISLPFKWVLSLSDKLKGQI